MLEIGVFIGNAPGTEGMPMEEGGGAETVAMGDGGWTGWSFT